MKKISALLVAAMFVFGVQGMALASSVLPGATSPDLVMLDEEEIIIVDEPVESGDLIVTEDGDVYEVQ